MTQARAVSEESAIINECRCDNTIPNKPILTATDSEKFFLERNKEGGGHGAVSIQETAKYRVEDEANKARTRSMWTQTRHDANATDDKRTGSLAENHSFTVRNIDTEK